MGSSTAAILWLVKGGEFASGHREANVQAKVEKLGHSECLAVHHVAGPQGGDRGLGPGARCGPGRYWKRNWIGCKMGTAAAWVLTRGVEQQRARGTVWAHHG